MISPLYFTHLVVTSHYSILSRSISKKIIKQVRGIHHIELKKEKKLIIYLKYIPNINNKCSRDRFNVHPFGTALNLQPTAMILQQDCQRSGVCMRRDSTVRSDCGQYG